MSRASHSPRRFAAVAISVSVMLFAAGAWAQQNAPMMQASVPPSGAQLTPGQITGIQSPDYQLGSGDRVRITVFGQDDLSGEYAIDGTGQLPFPLIGAVKAGGLTALQLGQEITNKLKPDYLKDPNISVQVLSYRPFYIIGEVNTPGSYPYVNGMAVINAIALAGGFTYRARESSFYLDRKSTDGKMQRQTVTRETDVKPGDVITVRERYF